MFDKLVDEWLSNLKEKPDWLHVEAWLVNNQNFQAPLEPQAAAELLCSTWFHDFEASFSPYFFIQIFFIKQEKSYAAVALKMDIFFYLIKKSL